MTRPVVCLDTGVVIKFLVPEAPIALRKEARQLVRRSLRSGRLVAPAFSWAEVGSVLRKKVRQLELSTERAHRLWAAYHRLQIDFVDSTPLHTRAWEIAERYELPTLYDASFLACTEVALAPTGATREFWTSDLALVRSLGTNRPPYVRVLGEERG